MQALLESCPRKLSASFSFVHRLLHEANSRDRCRSRQIEQPNICFSGHRRNVSRTDRWVP